MTNKEKFLALVSHDETNAVAELKERIARRAYTKYSKKIALAILIRLDELKWKQVTLAEKMGVSAQQVNKWVKGGENLTLETLGNLSNVLGLELISVVGEQSSAVAQNVQYNFTEDYSFYNKSLPITLEYRLHVETNYENNFLKAQ